MNYQLAAEKCVVRLLLGSFNSLLAAMGLLLDLCFESRDPLPKLVFNFLPSFGVLGLEVFHLRLGLLRYLHLFRQLLVFLANCFRFLLYFLLPLSHFIPESVRFMFPTLGHAFDAVAQRDVLPLGLLR